MQNPSEIVDFRGVLVRVARLERAVSWSQTYSEHFFYLILVVFSHFHSVPVALLHFLTRLFPGVPGLPVVIYVVKNASRPVPSEHSPAPGRKRFSFQVVCIATLPRWLCKWFLPPPQFKSCAAIDKEIGASCLTQRSTAYPLSRCHRCKVLLFVREFKADHVKVTAKI